MTTLAQRRLARSKDAERRVADVVGGERAWKEKWDVHNDWAVFEVKSRKRLPRWLIEGVGQVRAAAAETGKEPILVLEDRQMGLRIYAHPGDDEWKAEHGD